MEFRGRLLGGFLFGTEIGGSIKKVLCFIVLSFFNFFTTSFNFQQCLFCRWPIKSGSTLATWFASTKLRSMSGNQHNHMILIYISNHIYLDLFKNLIQFILILNKSAKREINLNTNWNVICCEFSKYIHSIKWWMKQTCQTKFSENVK